VWWARVKGYLRVISIVLLFIGAIYSFFYVKRSSQFQVREISIAIEGQGRLTKEEVLKLSDIMLGTNIFDINLAKVCQRLELHPWIAKAFVSRNLPDKIFIKVQEEDPIAMVAGKGGVFLVNQEGRLFAKAPQDLMKELPALYGVSKKEFQERSLSPRKVQVLKLLSYLKKNDSMVPPYANISQIKFLPDGFVLLTKDALAVQFAGTYWKEYLAAYRKLDRIFVYLYDTKQYDQVKTVRLDYPENRAALIFKNRS